MTDLTNPRVYIPVRQQLEALWPQDLIAVPDLSILDGIWLRPAEIVVDGEPPALVASSGLLFDTALEVGIPGFDVVTFSLGDPAAGTEVPLRARLATDRFEIAIGPVPLNVNLRTELLVKAEDVSTDPSGPRVFEARPDEPLSIQVGEVRLSWATDGSISFEAIPTFELPFAMLADTGIVVAASDLRLALDARTAAELPLTAPRPAPGLYLGSASVYFPGELAGVIPDDVQVTDTYLSHGGLSATITGNWNPSWDAATSSFTGSGSGDLLGLPFGVERVQVVLEQNLPVESAIDAQVLVPYFDEPAAVSVQLGLDGDFTLGLRALDDDGFTVRKEELLALTLKELTIAKEADVGTLVISGGLQPLLMASDGIEWPRIDVIGIELDTTGRILIREAWLELNDLSTIDLFGFQFELTRLGVGYEEATDSLWIDLTGSIRLIEHIPIGFGVEGFRLTWPRTLYEDLQLDDLTELDLEHLLAIASQIQVRFAGLLIFYGVPQTVEFEGLIRFFKEAQLIGFAGDVALRMPASGFALEAGLMLGINFEEPPYPFLYLYLGVELPSGIPLGQSGLALKGALGLLGLNVEPARDAPENWYFDWYKRGPSPGAHQTTKWRNARLAAAVGVGVTITTTDGYIVGIRGLIVLAVPGPILMLEGRALVFDGLLPLEPPLRALAVLDGKQRTMQLNLEAQGTVIEDILEAYAPMEAFFDFVDLTNWHLYLGQDEPAERRVQASILKFGAIFLFKAEAFLMIDMVGAHTVRARMGVLVAFEPPIPSLGPVQVQFRGVLEGGAEVTVLPEQFSGEVLLSAEIGIQAFGFGFRIAADGDVLAEGADPFSVQASLHLEVELPNPMQALEVVPLVGDVLPDIEPIPPIEVDLEFSWESPPALEPVSPLADIVITERLASAQAALTATTTEIAAPTAAAITAARLGADDQRAAAEAAPVVGLDAMPMIRFDQNMNDETGADLARHPDGVVFDHRIGRLRIEPALGQVRIHRHRRADGWTGDFDTDWTLLASTDPAEAQEALVELFGVWHADVDPGQAAAAVRRLRLWSSDPLSHTRGSLGPGYGGLTHSAGTTVAAGMLDDRPHYWRLDIQPGELCAHPPAAFGRGFHRRGDTATAGPVALELLGEAEVDADETCLVLTKGLRIRLAESVDAARIGLCKPSPYELSRVITAVRRDAGRAAVHLSFADEHGIDVTISGSEPFDELVIVADLAIAGLCFVPGHAHDRIARATSQDAINDRVTHAWAAEAPVLEPDCDYRIEIVTSTSAELLPGDGALGAALDALYTSALEALTGSSTGGSAHFVHEAHFRTVGPPTDLGHYLASTYPAPNAADVARGDDFAIRFRSPNVAAMFAGDGIGDLELALLGPDGHVVDGYTSVWETARSATLHHDERLWLQHLGLDPDDPDGPLSDDDVLVLRRDCLFRDAFAERGSDGWELLETSLPQRRSRPGRPPTPARPGATLPGIDRLRTGRPRIDISGPRARIDLSAPIRPGAAGTPLLVNGDAAWTDVAIEAVVTLAPGGLAGIAGRIGTDGSRYEAIVDHDHVRLVRVPAQRDAAPARVLADDAHRRHLDGGHLMRLVLDGATLAVELDGQMVLKTFEDLKPLTAGRIGLVVAHRGTTYEHVCVRRGPARVLKPRARYELVATGGVGGRALTEPSALTAAHRDVAVNCELRPSAAPVGVSLRSGGVVVQVTTARVTAVDAIDGEFASASITLADDEWYPVRVEMVGDRLRVRVNGARRLDVTVPDSVPATGVVASAPADSDRLRAFELREAALLRIPFVTSRAETLQERVPTAGIASVFDRGAIGPAAINLALLDDAADELRRGAVALRDELIDREALEQRRLVERDARAAQDAVARGLAEAAGVDPYGQVEHPGSIAQAFAGDDASSPLVAVVMRTTESLDYRFARHGRTTVALSSRASSGDGWSPVPVDWAWTGDGTLLVGVLGANPPAGADAELRLELSYSRDLGDEDQVVDHRFDRPVRPRDGRTDPEVATIAWRRHGDD